MDYAFLNTLVEGYDREQVISDLIRTYQTDVWDYAFSLTRSADMADDIAQEVFLRVYENLHTFRGQASIKTWILKITRNRSLNWKNSGFVRKVLLAGEQLISQAKAPSAEDQALDNMLSNQAWRLVMKLPVKHREILILHAYHSLNQQEIATLLDIPEGTVKSRLYHARIKLAKLYEGEMADG